MQGTTLAVALAGAILVLLLRPSYALVAYIAALVWYPDYLRVTIGTLDISVGRVVVTVLLLRCLCDSQLWRMFVWSRLDTWVTLSMVVYVGMYLLTRPLMDALENRSGFLMDTWFAYMAVRLIITDREKLVSFIKGTSIVLAALSVLGILECVTHKEFFLQLKRFRPWNTPIGEIIVEGRWGLSRATGPFSHSIMFGTCFVMFLPLIWVLRHQRGYWGKLAYLLSGITVIGALSSMSSGPWVSVTVAVLLLVLERYKRWTKPLLIALAAFCLLIAVVSNRPFYHVIVSYANPVGGSGWQRAKLIDCAIEDFSKWWWLGYGGQDPGWGTRLGMGHTDCNNEFIVAGVDYGIWGVIALCSVLAVAIRTLVRLHNLSSDNVLRSWFWSLGTILVVTIVVWQGVSFFGQMPTIFYCILGVVGSAPNLALQPIGSQRASILTGYAARYSCSEV